MIARYAIPFFFVMTLVVAPVVFALLSRWLLPKYWKRVACACTLLIYILVGYGTFVEYPNFKVRHVEYVSADLPEAFDGYRIVMFSDAHVGTMTGLFDGLLQRAVDSINAQRADAIVFVGDLENIHPDELKPQLATLSQLKAKDGVYSVLGNHDYPTYLDCDEAMKKQCIQQTTALERQTGWQLLLNEHRVILRPKKGVVAQQRSDSDSIVIAGMENWGKVKRMPRRGDVKKTLEGINCQTFAGEGQRVGVPFILMLQHDPTCWRKHILPESHAQLTLSGHTHGGQFSLFGWSPATFSYTEWGGMAYEGPRAIYVSVGLGALIPFRLNMTGEIVVVTLKKG